MMVGEKAATLALAELDALDDLRQPVAEDAVEAMKQAFRAQGLPWQWIDNPTDAGWERAIAAADRARQQQWTNVIADYLEHQRCYLHDAAVGIAGEIMQRIMTAPPVTLDQHAKANADAQAVGDAQKTPAAAIPCHLCGFPSNCTHVGICAISATMEQVCGEDDAPTPPLLSDLELRVIALERLTPLIRAMAERLSVPALVPDGPIAAAMKRAFEDE